MRDVLAERLLASVMDWGAEDVARERPRLQALATFKYDEYQQYTPGERFVERLARWLCRFIPEHRHDAYQFVLSRLVFISNAEMQHFIGMAYRDRLRPHIVSKTAASLGMPQWRHTSAAMHSAFRDRARRCLLLGLSDGAHLDSFRRSTHQLFTTEQFFASYEVPANRCTELRDKLEIDLRVHGNLTQARFHTIVLLDDFAGSGMSFVREKDGRLRGKLVTFLDELTVKSNALAEIVNVAELEIVVLYYVASSAAVAYLQQQFVRLEKQYGIAIRLMTVHTLSPSIVLDRNNTLDTFVQLLQQYYDPTVEDKHTWTGGSDMIVGYANGGLPVVLAHNTPNNAPSLLWYESDVEAPALFPRVARHVDPAREL